MPVNGIDLHLFFFQNIHADSERSERRIQVHPHKIRQVHPAVRLPHKKRSALSAVGDKLAGQVAVGQKAATVGISLQCRTKERFVELVLCEVCLDRGGEFSK